MLNLTGVLPTRRLAKQFGILLLVSALAVGCTKRDVTQEFHDPHEERNREVHEENKKFDSTLVQPIAEAYGRIVPPTPDSMISNFAANLSLPGRAANSLLQFDVPNVIATTARFAVNTTIGLGGLFDPATKMNISDDDADFGGTLHKWGVPEGAYIALPFFGPSTERDAIGLLVDLTLDPASAILPGGSRAITTSAFILDRLGDRNDYADIVDNVLYESEDSYAASRLIYLQNRRRSLNDGLTDDDLEDPYAE